MGGIGASDGAFYENHISLAAGDDANASDDSAAGMASRASRKAADVLERAKGTLPSLDSDTGIDGPIIAKTPDYLRKLGIDASFTEKGMEQATNLALGFSGGGLTFAGVKGIGNLKGTAKSEALSNLGYAQVLEANGIHPNDIHTTTGFSRGADGKWRYEIDDSKAKFNHEKLSGDPTARAPFLDEVYDHPDLYATYPHLKDIFVATDPNLAGAYYNHDYPAIILGGKRMPNTGRLATQDQGILAHEIQHAIQQYEGFTPGATFEGAPDSNASKFYLRNAGEVEARNTDTRLNLNSRLRQNVPPTWSEDYPRSQQIVTKGVGIGTEEGMKDSATGAMSKSK